MPGCHFALNANRKSVFSNFFHILFKEIQLCDMRTTFFWMKLNNSDDFWINFIENQSAFYRKKSCLIGCLTFCATWISFFKPQWTWNYLKFKLSSVKKSHIFFSAHQKQRRIQYRVRTIWIHDACACIFIYTFIYRERYDVLEYIVQRQSHRPNTKEIPL